MTDIEFKVAFRQYAVDFLSLLGDAGSALRSADVVELQDLRRTVDCVLELQRGKQVYYRHVEFQSEPDPRMAERCLRYNVQLLLQLGQPVLTTVLYLFPPAPPELSYRVVIEGEEVNVWRFGVVRLWELEARDALASGKPGLLAVVPLLSGATLATVGEAVRGIERALPGERNPDAIAILLLFAGRYYTVDQLVGVVGRDRMIQSSVWQAALAEGKAEGKAEGELMALRESCLELVRKHHPVLLSKATPLIETCDDPGLLKSWLLAASDPDETTFARLLGLR